ncbi:MAG TPA: aldo/keto reductase, partial [Mycobacterium sp.]|nr:aldo/keto reductase [Mycobacterium sp.]
MSSAASIPNVSLNDENTIPVLGIGVGELSEAQTEQAVSAALEIGVRLIDTAAAYGNEAAVGRAIAASGVPRAEIFITTKLATENQGFKSSRDACEASVERLGLDYVDLYLIHWPAGDPGKYVDSWGGMMKAREVGHTRSIGVANFTPEDLSNVIDLSFFVPAVNQIELHPLLNQADLRAVNAEHGIVTEAYGPLGVGRLVENPTVVSVASEYGKTPAQTL